MISRILLIVCALSFAVGGRAGAADLLPAYAGPSPHAPPPAAQPVPVAAKPIDTEPLWAVAIIGGRSAGDTRLLREMAKPWDSDYQDEYLLGGMLSRRLVRFWNYFFIDGELGTAGRFGIQHSIEGWAALYLRFDGFPWREYLYTTVGVSTGVNLISSIPPAEQSATHTAHLLHYFSPEISFALPQYRNDEVFIRFHHRSGIYGLFFGVSGGSNILTAGYRHHFNM